MSVAQGYPTRISWMHESAAAGRARLGRTAEVLGAALARSAFPANIAVLLAELPAAAMERLIGAPELYRQLACAQLKLSALSALFLERSLAAEVLLAEGRSIAEAPGAWTAAADAYFPRMEDDGWLTQAPFLAPKLASAVVLDFHAPRRCALPGWGDGKTLLPPSATVLSEEMQQRVTERLAEAYRGIGDIFPEAQALVRDCLVCIMIVADPLAPDTFYSGSNRLAVGRMSLINPDLPHVSTARLGEALVHEALHAYLYSLEWAGRWFVGPPQSWEAEVTSPWSGRRLPLVSFVHACFVWDVLHEFWRRPRAAAVFGDAARKERLAQARRGFGAGAISVALGKSARILAPGLLRELLALQRAWSAV